ncbi:MAG: carboxypeptidase-like regulatory domain-containing protein [Terracidiphilus sp.]|nr:carboxypeptidase-like regulatory domain-containing protein [Terracidiphilus sp.]
MGVSAVALIAGLNACTGLAAQQPDTDQPRPAALVAATTAVPAPDPAQQASPAKPGNSGAKPPQSASVVTAGLGTINGTVTDAQDEVIPGAVVTLEGPDPGGTSKATANDNGFFEFTNLRPGTGYRITIKAKGLVDWVSPALELSPGQVEIVPNIMMQLQGEQTSVTVYASPEELATEQVKIAEQQRVLGVIPNFYVVYDRNAPPLTAKSKYQLALKVSYDPITIAGIFFIAGVNQGVRIPDYRLGAEGYGKRVGAVATDGFTDIFFGGAVLPALLHQDPRYFYQGTGTNRSRLFHALSAPFVCRGDNLRTEPNFSTIGGDMISAGFSTLYYPRNDRTWTFFGENVMISTIERTASTVTQEFVLRHFTTGPKGKNAAPQDRQ